MFTKVSFKVHGVDNSKISNEGLFCNCNHRFKIKTNNENIYFKVTNIIRYPCKGWWRILDGLSRHRLQRKSVFGSSGEKARVGLCLCPPIAPCVISTVHAVLLPPGKDACPSPGYWRLLLSSPRESILMRSFFLGETFFVRNVVKVCGNLSLRMFCIIIFMHLWENSDEYYLRLNCNVYLCSK